MIMNVRYLYIYCIIIAFDDISIDVKMYRTWPSFWPCHATPVNQRHFSTETKAAAECFRLDEKVRQFPRTCGTNGILRFSRRSMF